MAKRPQNSEVQMRRWDRRRNPSQLSLRIERSKSMAAVEQKAEGSTIFSASKRRFNKEEVFETNLF